MTGDRLAARLLEIVDIASESRDEAALAAHVLAQLPDARDAGDTCVLAGVTDVPDGRILSVRTRLAPELTLGESVAVNGVCLTVTATTAEEFRADVGPETLRVTSLGGAAPGAPLNLERAMCGDSRFGGHFVQGHVDGVGTIARRTPGPRWDDVEIDVAPELARYVAEKGSVTVSGVSLTVTQVRDDGFGISLIPTTLEATTPGRLAPGAQVNIEVDVLAKYVERLLATGGITR